MNVPVYIPPFEADIDGVPVVGGDCLITMAAMADVHEWLSAALLGDYVDVVAVDSETVRLAQPGERPVGQVTKVAT